MNFRINTAYLFFSSLLKILMWLYENMQFRLLHAESASIDGLFHKALYSNTSSNDPNTKLLRKILQVKISVSFSLRFNFSNKTIQSHNTLEIKTTTKSHHKTKKTLKIYTKEDKTKIREKK